MEESRSEPSRGRRTGSVGLWRLWDRLHLDGLEFEWRECGLMCQQNHSGCWVENRLQGGKRGGRRLLKGGGCCKKFR